MTLNIYLHFENQCAEAFDFYKDVFNGEVLMKSTFADAPPEMGVPDAHKNRVMHISLKVGDSVLMGSDSMPGQGEKPNAGTNIQLSYAPKSKEEADKVFDKLSSGGGVAKMAMQDTFWNAYFGMCRDKYGFDWMINYSKS